MAAPQESRAGEIAATQAEKAQRLHPHTVSTVERIMARLERVRFDPPPVMLLFDSVLSGGGFTAGARVQRPFGDRVAIGVNGLLSAKSYKLIEGNVVSPGHLSDRLDLAAAVGWRDATEVAYYGLGSGTSPDARANYRMKQTYYNGRLVWRPARWFPVEGSVSFEDYRLEPGKGSEPSIETIFTPATAPGLGDSPSFVHAFAQASIDTRPAPGYARTGGQYGAAFHRYHDPDRTYSFDRVDVMAVQHIPVLRETWVVSLRGRVQSTIGDESVVPYFLMPSLGGGSSLRGFGSWRFRDRHALLTTIEWRWIPNRLGLDMALFYDAGHVAARRADLSLAHLQTNWGVGARFHGPFTTPLRIELAKGAEGWHLVFASSAAF
jgi:hypothetical protein